MSTTTNRCFIGEGNVKVGTLDAKDITECSISVTNDLKETTTRENVGSNKTYDYNSVSDIELSFTLKVKDTSLVAVILAALLNRTTLAIVTSSNVLNISGNMVVASLNNDQPLEDCETIPVSLKPYGAITVTGAGSDTDSNSNSDSETVVE